MSEAVVSITEQEDLFGNPYRSDPSIDRTVLAEALRSAMSSMTLDQLVAMITNEYVEVFEYAALARGDRGVSQKLSLLFNPHRLDTPTYRGRSVYQALSQDNSFYNALTRCTLVRQYERTRPLELFYSTLSMGVNGVQYAHEYPPHVARDWCLRYNLTSESSVLDPCAGWGGRMIGCSTVVDNYQCYEPSTRTVDGLINLAAFILRMRKGFKPMIACQAYEDSIEHPDSYDLALTSPPYYDSEIYSDEPTNSCNRYANFDLWCSGFYLPLIDKTMRQLKPSAPFILNIGDRRWPLSEVMLNYCETRNYKVKRLDGDISNPAWALRQHGAGEKFYEITKE